MANFGIDIDDVIFKSSDVLKDALVKCEDKDILEHKLDIMRGDILNKKIGDFLKKNVIPIIKVAKPMENASEIIKKIRKQSNKIIIITARGDLKFPGSEEITLNLLKKYEIEYDDIIFNSDDKVKACKDNDIDIFVDDSPKHCLSVSEDLGIPVIGFLSDINREEMIQRKIRCVESWDELYEILNKKEWD